MSTPTIKQQLDWASETLKSSNIENAHLETEVLLSHILKIDRAKLLTLYNSELKNGKTEKLKNLVERRAKREPLQYITGIAHFMSMAFEVTPEVLIPRPETELLVETVIQLVNHKRGGDDSRDTRYDSRITILDIGTGSGAIAVSLAHYLPEITVLGIDIDEKVIRVANKNAQKHNVSDRCKFIVGNIAEAFLPTTDYRLLITDYLPRRLASRSGQAGRLLVHRSSQSGGGPITGFDFIISNPPYIPTADIPKLQPELQFEPRSALDGGADGLDYYRKIIPEADKHLKDNGYLVLEVGEGQAEAVEKILKQNRYREINKLRDLNQIERVIYGLKWDN